MEFSLAVLHEGIMAPKSAGSTIFSGGDPTSFTDWAGSLGTGMLKVLLKVGYLFNVLLKVGYLDDTDSTLSRHFDSEEDTVLSILAT